jgi:hypothetical protein
VSLLSAPCSCVDVAMGSYANAEVRMLPFATERWPEPGTKPVQIDRCILPLIELLWSLGIETVESCCGHGQLLGYVIVADRDIGRTRALGLTFDYRSSHAGAFILPPPPTARIHEIADRNPLSNWRAEP